MVYYKFQNLVDKDYLKSLLPFFPCHLIHLLVYTIYRIIFEVCFSKYAGLSEIYCFKFVSVALVCVKHQAEQVWCYNYYTGVICQIATSLATGGERRLIIQWKSSVFIIGKKQYVWSNLLLYIYLFINTVSLMTVAILIIPLLHPRLHFEKLFLVVLMLTRRAFENKTFWI